MSQRFVYKMKGKEYFDTIDPVVSHVETEEKHFVFNGFHEYVILKSEIEEWHIVDVLEEIKL